MIRFLSWFLAKGIDLASWVLEDTGTGEIAEHPDRPEEMDEACALTRRPLDYPTTPAERRFADDVETFLKELAR